MKLASRMDRLGSETAFEVLAKARALEAQGRNIVHLEIGEPDFDTPAPIREAAKRALDEGFTHYGPSPGLPQVRERIATAQSLRTGYEVSPSQVVVTPGGKPIMFFSIMALVEEGDEVIYPNPGFPIYESMIRFVGGTPVPVQLHEESGYNLDIQELRQAAGPKTKLIIVNSPNNPCGSVVPAADLEAIAEVANEVDAIVLSDEIYHDFYYEGSHESITRYPEMSKRTIILDGFSKSYAMTGWRLGYGVFPEPLVEPISRLVTNSVSCTSAFSQMAALAALDDVDSSVREMVAEFQRRRDIIVPGLNAIPGITCPTPKGAFYTFPNIRGTGMTSQEFADGVLNEAGVAVLAGTSFGRFGEGYVRLSFANSAENIREALRRIEAFLAQR
jgi:aspartate aminotransferase